MSKQDIPDLIPDDFGTVDVTPPIALLRAQQKAIPKKTQGIIEAVINSTTKGGGFTHTFFLNVPALEDYTYQLFVVRHGIDLYPAEVYDPETRLPTHCYNPDDFLDALGMIFRSTHFKKVVNSLMAQVKESQDQ